MCRLDRACTRQVWHTAPQLSDMCPSPQVRHWGLSNETPYGVCKMCEVAAKLGVPPPVSIQNDFS